MSLIFGFIFGTILGSFVKVLADRSLGNKSFWGRSYCLSCKRSLPWYDLFPILSYVLLSGRCRYCKKAVSIEYLVVESAVGVLVGFLFWQSFNNFQFSFFLPDLIFKTFFICVLAVLFVTDLKEMFIPDRIILPAILIGVIYLFLVTQNFLIPLLMGILIAGFFMALIIITCGKGMGGGDVKLGAFIGLVLGFPLGLLAIITSFLLGAAASVFLIIAGKKHFGQSIPFGPFLVLGSLISLFWGKEIIDWYLSLG